MPQLFTTPPTISFEEAEAQAHTVWQTTANLRQMERDYCIDFSKTIELIDFMYRAHVEPYRQMEPDPDAQRDYEFDLAVMEREEATV